MKLKYIFYLFIFTLISMGCQFGNGKIYVEIIYPEKTLVYPNLKLIMKLGEGEPKELSNKEGGIISESGLEAGSYQMTIQLRDGETVVWKKDVSCIIDGGIETKIIYTIVEDDFTDFALYPPEIIVTELGGDRYKVEIISPNHKGEIRYTLANPAEDPTVSATEYKSAFEVDYTTEQGKTLTARAFYKEWTPSEAAVFYFIKVQTPTLTETTTHRLAPKLTYEVGNLDSEATYYYTLDGTMPTLVSNKTEGVIEIDKEGTITVKGHKPQYLMSDAATQAVGKLPTPTFGPVSENADNTTYSVTISYGTEAQQMFLKRDNTAVTVENCPMDTAIDVTGDYPITDLDPTETLKTRSVAPHFLASDEAVLESSMAEKPIITDGRDKNQIWANPLTVVFNTPETEATIRYTFNGDVPKESDSSAAAGEEVSVDTGTTTVKGRSYVGGKYPSEVAEQAVGVSVAPQSVSLGYMNELIIEEAATVPDTETATRKLFYQTTTVTEWTTYEAGSCLEETIETTVTAVGGAQFHFPSTEVSKTFSSLITPIVKDARTATDGYLNPLKVDLTGGTALSGTQKIFLTRNGEKPTKANAIEETNPTEVEVGSTEKISYVLSDLNNLTSQPANVDGTPLGKPRLSSDSDGKVTIEAAEGEESVAGICFYYKTDGTSEFSEAAPGELYDEATKPTVAAGEQIYAVAVAPLRNKSEAGTLNKADIQVVDSRNGEFYKPLTVTFTGLEAGESVKMTCGAKTLTWNEGEAAVDISTLTAGEVSYTLVSPNRYSDTKKFNPTGLVKPEITFNNPQVTITNTNPPPCDVWYTLGTDIGSLLSVTKYTTPFENTTGEPITAAAGAELKHPAVNSFTPEKAQTPTVTDARKQDPSTAKDFFSPRPDGVKQFDLKVTSPQADGSKVFYTPPGGAETEVTANKVTVTQIGNYVFVAKGDDMFDSEPVTVTVADLTKPTFGNEGLTLTITSAEGGSILYEKGNPAPADVSETSSEYNGPLTVAPGDTVKAVAVKEFCFSSEQNEITIPESVPLEVWFEKDGTRISNQILSEEVEVTVCVPDIYQTRTIKTSLVAKDAGAGTYSAYTYGDPITIDESKDLHVQVYDAAGTNVEKEAVLKIRLKCPFPQYVLEVNSDKTAYQLTFPTIDTTKFDVEITKNGTTTTYTDPYVCNSSDSVSVTVKRTGWDDSDAVVITIPEILMKIE